MPDQARRLTELVRLLEEDGYIFSADPEAVTEALRHEEGGAEQRLLRRAALIDSNGRLADALQRSRSGVFWLWLTAATLLFSAAFSATYALMDEKGLNFFLILAGVLGANTVMLLVWLAAVVVLRRQGTLPVSCPSGWLRGRGAVGQALLHLSAEEWRRPQTRWIVGAASHSLWLATLSGMLVCILLLLSVRQYTFNWESTLLDGTALVGTVSALAKFPAALGFPAPDAAAVLQGRLNGNAADAQAWAWLLVGCIFCYGILPRLTAWAACKLLVRRAACGLPLDKPYYQNIIRRWQTRITDADTQREAVPVLPPRPAADGAAQWAVMLETDWPDKNWYRSAAARQWLDKGTAAGRDAVAALLAELAAQPVQLLIGIRAHTVPDRGILRQTAALAAAAKGGAIVQLLQAAPVSDGLEDMTKQWQSALSERNIPCLLPPQAAQKRRRAQAEAGSGVV
nr:DUF2868 domain-containing protein [Kingella potus]